LEGKYANFEVTENNWIHPHVLRADILSGRDIQTFEKLTWFGIIILRDRERRPGQQALGHRVDIS
jgi:hypothetical protein